MNGPLDAAVVIAQTQELIARAKRSLQDTEGFFNDRRTEALRILSELKRQREEEMRSFVFDQVALAAQKPPCDAAILPIEAPLVFARSIYRRRQII